eukprot:4633968-Pleurochrysis_carterae.AAC.1
MTCTGQTEVKGGSPNYWPDLIGIVHWHILLKRLVLWTVCISPIQRVPIYDMNKLLICTTPHRTGRQPMMLIDGYGYNSAPHSLIFLITPEYEPPAFDYSSGLCYIPSRKASMVNGHGVGLFHWGRGISVYRSLCNATYFAVRTPLKTVSPFLFSEYRHYEYPFRPPSTPDIGDAGTDNLEC